MLLPVRRSKMTKRRRIESSTVSLCRSGSRHGAVAFNSTLIFTFFSRLYVTNVARSRPALTVCLTPNADEDSPSDWSTDSCGWSDGDLGAEPAFATPPLSVDSGAVDTGDQEIVRCVCEVEEENDFMIQVGEEGSVCRPPPRRFAPRPAADPVNGRFSAKTVCAGNTAPAWACWRTTSRTATPATSAGTRPVSGGHRPPPRRRPPLAANKPPRLAGQRPSLRYWYDREWLSNGRMYGLSFLEENYSHQNAKKITTTHQLLGDVHHLVEVLSGLQLKMSVLQ